MLPFTPVYLLRKGNPPYLARRFLTRYFKYDAGADVRLILLLKGYRKSEIPSELTGLSDSKLARVEFVYVADDGMDLTAYRSLCAQRRENHFLFLNSNSQILSPFWHEAFTKALTFTKGEGLIGASGSYEAHAQFNMSMPNPHIRTNGFLVGREAYISAAKGPLLTKQECHQLESGENSLTRYFLDRDFLVVLVNADSQIFQIDDWPSSRTFRLHDQEKLLVGDNRSEKYHSGFAQRRKLHAGASWGDAKQVTGLALGETIKRLVWNRWSASGHRIALLKLLIEGGLSK